MIVSNLSDGLTGFLHKGIEDPACCYSTMRNFKFLLSVILVSGLVACSPGYIEPLNELVAKSEDAKVSIRMGEEGLVGENAPLIILDGKRTTREALVDMDPNNIASVNVIKGKSAIAAYGDQGKNGVIIIVRKD